ncbi:MAG: hypothetical protein ACHQ1D_00550 [Nitrososphaerales archaeon]
MNKPLSIHRFNFSPSENGGESLTITTEFLDNGDHALGLPKGIFTNQKLILQSYGNSASINLYGIQITSDKLRELANQLDKEMALLNVS